PAARAAVAPAWHGSQAEAASHRKHLNSVLKIKRDHITTEEVDVPTDKKGLLNFLNGWDS
ncbi:MAG: hypothetical protein GX856_03230, partial [Gammaproteobacteria bacterium]|nr:hypothetical protein [Gammaproteobacteria bacterium]